MSDQVNITPINTETLLVPIRGLAPLICHRFTEKAKRTMLDAMQGKKNVREHRDPETDYRDAMYLLDDDTPGFPVIGFKAATVSASRFYGKDVPMTMLRQAVFMDGEFSKQSGQKLARLDGAPSMREDVVRVGNKGTDLRYRPEFQDWATTLTVTYVKSLLSRDSLLSLLEAGGLGVGVGEWRPERNGEFGTYAIDPTREVIVRG